MGSVSRRGCRPDPRARPEGRTAPAGAIGSGSSPPLRSADEWASQILPSYLTTLGSSAGQIAPGLSPGDILGLEEDGTRYAIDHFNASVRAMTNIREAAGLIDMLPIYDNTTVVGALGGAITLNPAAFDDFAVYRNSLVVSGFSNGFEFVARLTMQNGLISGGGRS